MTQLVSNHNKDVHNFLPMNNLVNIANYIEEAGNLIGKISGPTESPEAKSRSKRPHALFPLANGGSESFKVKVSPKDRAKPMAKRNDGDPVKIIQGSIFMQLPGFKVGGMSQGLGLGGSPKTQEASPDAIPEKTKLDMFRVSDKTLGRNLFGGFDPDRSARESFQNQVTTVTSAPAPDLDMHHSAKKSPLSQKSGRRPRRKPTFMDPESSWSDDEIELFENTSLPGKGNNHRLERKDTITRDCLVNVYGHMKS